MDCSHCTSSLDSMAAPQTTGSTSIHPDASDARGTEKSLAMHCNEYCNSQNLRFSTSRKA